MFFRKITTIFYLIIFLISNNLGIAGYDDGESVYSYDGTPGCGCFYNCGCFSHYISDTIDGGFPDDTPWHPCDPEDKVWHEFMKKFLLAIKKGPYFKASRSTVHHMVQASNIGGYLCLLSEYLNASNELRKTIELARIENVKFYEDLYKDPKQHKERASKINQINNKANNALQILASIPETIIPIYKEIIENCIHKESYNMVLTYNRGLISLLEGNINESLSDILSFIELAKKSGRDILLLTSEVLQKQGEVFLEVGLYNQAIESLNLALSKNPDNFEAYFHRASAYFETGDFDRSLQDYILSKKSDLFVPYNLAPNEFIDAFSEAAFSGAHDATCEFFPSLCYSAYGLSKCLWAFGEHSVDSVQNLACAGYEIAEHVVDYLKTVDRNTLHNYSSEFVKLYDNFSQLSEKEKGSSYCS